MIRLSYWLSANSKIILSLPSGLRDIMNKDVAIKPILLIMLLKLENMPTWEILLWVKKRRKIHLQWLNQWKIVLLKLKWQIRKTQLVRKILLIGYLNLNQKLQRWCPQLKIKLQQQQLPLLLQLIKKEHILLAWMAIIKIK